MPEEQKTKRVFFFNEETCDCPFYCGPLSDRDGTMKAIGYMLAPAFEELQSGQSEAMDFFLEVREMTDAEVAALPDM